MNCILYHGRAKPTGYAQMLIGNKQEYVHRVAYRLAKGRIPKGYQVDHLCKTRSCINPDHLEAVTPQVNVSRAGNHYRDRTHCQNGHILVGKHIRLYHGYRYCRICRTAYNKRRWSINGGIKKNRVHLSRRGSSSVTYCGYSIKLNVTKMTSDKKAISCLRCLRSRPRRKKA